MIDFDHSRGKRERQTETEADRHTDRQRQRKIQMVYLTSAIAHVNVHNTVHKNNVHISREIDEFPVP